MCPNTTLIAKKILENKSIGKELSFKNQIIKMIEELETKNTNKCKSKINYSRRDSNIEGLRDLVI